MTVTLSDLLAGADAATRRAELDAAEREAREALLRCSARTVDLPDGTVGYFGRPAVKAGYFRRDDCFTAAVATVLQLPISELPDPRFGERLAAGEDPEDIDRSARQQFARWLARRGLRMVTHRTLPVARRRWIGVVLQSGWFMDHCMVMAGDRILFDPTEDFVFVALAKLTPTAPRMRARVGAPEDVDYGISFQNTPRRR